MASLCSICSMFVVRSSLIARRVQLSLYVCSPFGEYELDMDIDSYSDESSTLQQRTSWLIKNGHDQVFTQEVNVLESRSRMYIRFSLDGVYLRPMTRAVATANACIVSLPHGSGLGAHYLFRKGCW